MIIGDSLGPDYFQAEAGADLGFTLSLEGVWMHLFIPLDFGRYLGIHSKIRHRRHRLQVVFGQRSAKR